MDASAYLQSHGWLGAGHPLRPPSSHASNTHPQPHQHEQRGLTHRLLVSKKPDSRGVGSKGYDPGNQWWLRAFEGALAGVNSSVVGGGEKKVEVRTMWGGMFVRGEGLGGTIRVEEEEEEEDRPKKRRRREDEAEGAGRERREVKTAKKEERRRLRRERRERRALVAAGAGASTTEAAAPYEAEAPRSKRRKHSDHKPHPAATTNPDEPDEVRDDDNDEEAAKAHRRAEKQARRERRAERGAKKASDSSSGLLSKDAHADPRSKGIKS